MGLFVALVEVIVSLIIIWFILKQKTGEKFSKKYIAKAIAFGIAGVILIMSLARFVPKNAFGSIENPVLRGFVVILVTAAILEEAVKYGLFRLSMLGSKEVGTIHDAIIASCLIAAGFTMFEDIYYSVSASSPLALFRVLIPAHILFGAVMGYYYGLAKKTGKMKYHVLSVLIPVLLHTIFDTPIAIIAIIDSPAANGRYDSYQIPVVMTWLVITIVFVILTILAFVRIKKGAKNSDLQVPILPQEAI